MLYSTVNRFLACPRWDDWRWPDFHPRELTCTCPQHAPTERFCDGEYWHDLEFMDALQTLRSLIGEPFVINSGHRCLGRNRFVGGARKSQHLAIAVDISLDTITNRERLYREAQDLGFTGIGRYITFIHLDRRPRGPARWWGRGARGYWH